MQRHAYGGIATSRLRAIGIILLVAHLLLVGWLTLRPRTVTWMAPANLRPLATIRAALALGPWEAAECLGPKLVLLAPLGVLLPLAGGRLLYSPLGSFIRTLLTGAMVSLTIELLQTGVTGQVVDVDSLLLNTTGVGLAHLAVVPAVRAGLRRREHHDRPEPRSREEEAQEAGPTIPRVGTAR